MQLLYIYLEEYRNFKKQGFSFTSEYNIYFKETKEQIVFSIEKNPNHIENFFDDEAIVDVTAIIGQNGSGKSNILDFIILSLTKNGLIPRNSIILFKEDESGIILSYGLHKKSYEIESTNVEIKKVLSHVLGAKSEDLPFDVMNQRLAQTDEIDFIYYSNNFDVQFTSERIKEISLPRPNQTFNNNFFNISTQSKIYTDQLEDENEIRNPLNADIETFGLNELHRNIEFILNQLNNNPQGLKEINFTIPEDIQLSFDNRAEKSLELDKNRYRIFSDIFLEARLPENTSLTAKAKLEVIKAFTYQILIYYGDYSKHIENYVSEEWEGFDSRNDLFVWFKRFIFLIDELNFADNKNDRNNLKTSPIIEFVEFMFEQIDLNRFQVEAFHEGQLLLLHISEENKETIFNVYKYQSELPVGIRPFYFGWHSLSSGEQSLLTLFSRFFELRNHPRFQTRPNKIILVDEGDLYFHPEWQRRYLNLFIKGVTNLLGKENRYQLIFTANTPFLAADLPSDKVIRFKKEETGILVEGLSQYKTQVQLSNETKTFAANIHTLLSDGFFLSSFLGEFAQEKIKRIADRLTDKKENSSISEEEKENIKRTINAIGEEIIRNRLITLFERKFDQPFSAQDLDQEINDLELRLENLRKKRGGLDDQN